MIRYAIRFGLTLAGLLALAPATVQAAKRPDDLASQLLGIERGIIRAYIARDTAVLERDYAAEYVHTNLIGQRQNKAEEIAEFKPGGAFTLAAATIDHGVATLYGDIAILRADVNWSGATYRAPGRPPVDISGTYSVTRAYVWRARRWQVVASHASRRPPQSPPPQSQ